MAAKKKAPARVTVPRALDSALSSAQRALYSVPLWSLGDAWAVQTVHLHSDAGQGKSLKKRCEGLLALARRVPPEAPEGVHAAVRRAARELAKVARPGVKPGGPK